MKGLRPALLLLTLAVTACASNRNPPDRPKPTTPECQHYHLMMTAPMLPDAVAALRQQCEASMR